MGDFVDPVGGNSDRQDPAAENHGVERAIDCDGAEYTDVDVRGEYLDAALVGERHIRVRTNRDTWDGGRSGDERVRRDIAVSRLVLRVAASSRCDLSTSMSAPRWVLH
jgi:hypothetical protein